MFWWIELGVFLLYFSVDLPYQQARLNDMPNNDYIVHSCLRSATKEGPPRLGERRSRVLIMNMSIDSIQSQQHILAYRGLDSARGKDPDR